jgi:NDP-sugar pyrophosphorylase family protein
MSNSLPKLPPIAVLAGGLATRLRPITETIPKALVDVAGEPFIAHQLRRFYQEGIRDVVMCLGYLGEQVVKYVGDGSQFGLNVTYSYDGDKLVGTGGAIRKALPLLGDVFYVTYGDTYLNLNYREAFEFLQKFPHSAGLLTVFLNENRWDTSNTVYRDGKLLAHSKRNRSPEMQYIDYGLSLFRKVDFTNWSGRFKADEAFELNEAFTDFIQQGRFLGFEVTKRFYEIGTPESLESTSRFLKNRFKSG